MDKWMRWINGSIGCLDEVNIKFRINWRRCDCNKYFRFFLFLFGVPKKLYVCVSFFSLGVLFSTYQGVNELQKRLQIHGLKRRIFGIFFDFFFDFDLHMGNAFWFGVEIWFGFDFFFFLVFGFGLAHNMKVSSHSNRVGQYTINWQDNKKEIKRQKCVSLTNWSNFDIA